MTDGFIGGWRQDKESWPLLRTLPREAGILAMRGTYTEVALDPREVITVEQQGNQGACQGHAISSCLEWIHCLVSGKTGTQLSRAYGYYETQRIDNLDGSDVGSTISGGIRLAHEHGIPEEHFWPYPPGYNNSRPSGWDALMVDAGKHKIGSTYRMSSYDGIRTFLGAGQGAISIGISWGSGMSRPVVERFSAGGGGHAIALLSLSERQDSAGNPYVWMLNSWGDGWPGSGASVPGWSEWSPSAIRQMMGHNFTVAVGVSDMPGLQPREFSLEDWQEALKP